MAKTRRPHRRSGKPRTWQFVVLGAAVIASSAAVWLAVQPNSSGPVAAEGTSRWTDSTPPPITREPVQAWVVGDSITVGTGAPTGYSYSDRLEAVMNWDVHVDGFGGSGYVGVGNQLPDAAEIVDHSFGTRLPELIEAQPDVVIIAGGRNDTNPDMQIVEDRAREYLTAMRAGLPDAQIVVLSPFLWHTSTEEWRFKYLTPLTDSLRQISGEIGGVFIDLHAETYVVDDSNKAALYADDGGHLNADGYRIFAEELARALVAHGVPRGPERWNESGFNTNEWSEAYQGVFTP